VANSRRHAVELTGRSVAVAAAALAAAYALVTVHFARSLVTPPRVRPDDIRVIAFDSDAATLTVSVSPDSVLPGEYGFWFDAGRGHARLGQVVRRDAATVVRRVIGVDLGDLATARTGRFASWFYVDPTDLGFPFETVSVPTGVGPAPAWLFPAEGGSSRWVIQVHGRAASRVETLRAVPVFRAAGFTSLLISYRNDSDAPASEDGRYGLGDTEWEDVDAAVAFALERGATEIVLMGWSMGGATVLQAATRRTHDEVSALVLESPVIEWVAALNYQARLLRLPRGITAGVYALIGRPWGRLFTGLHSAIDLHRLDFLHRAGELSVPILLLHSDDDGYVPAAASRALAAARPAIVSIEPVTTARHTRLWNYDRQRWEGAIRSWLLARRAA
jgi:alpha-beta hydrolase superfamily lysophospholipase